MTIPYAYAFAITPSATANFNIPTGFCDAIFVGGAGIVVAVLQNDDPISFTCVAGQILPVKAKRVNATSSATLMVALKY